MHAAGVLSIKYKNALFLGGGGVVLVFSSTELHKVSSFDIKLVSDLSICDGGHCLHVYEARLFTCKVSVAYLFLIRGSWF